MRALKRTTTLAVLWTTPLVLEPEEEPEDVEVDEEEEPVSEAVAEDSG